jgi:signal transduction histidine kinase/CheY-like chemotaxis protein
LWEANDGLEALALARDKKPDLIVADILMPTMDGYELVRNLRADPATSAIKVIFWTSSYRERESLALARSCGVTQVLLKPSEPEQVLQVVDEALGFIVPVLQPPLEGDFDREHLRLVTNKLSEQAASLAMANKRLAALIDFILELAAEPDPYVVLKMVCRAARDLVGAKYAAVGVHYNGGGSQGTFATSGLDDETSAVIGSRLSRGEVIRNLMRSRRACRFTSLSGDAQAMGFPPRHPPVHSFLGTPIYSSTDSHGWFCLTNKLGAEAFTDEDERITNILAAQVAHLYDMRGLQASLQRKAGELEREVQERKKAEQEVRELNAKLELRVLERTAELQVANQELEAFSYSISHDLRAPLRHIHGFTELLKESLGPEPPEKVSHFLAQIDGSATQMSQLVDDLLAFSRMGRIEMRREPVDLQAQAEAVISQLAPDTQDREILWQVGLLPKVQGDAAMLRQALMNLVSNAIKYTRPRRPARIEIGTLAGLARETVIFVRDNGVGFDMACVDKLFGVFQRLHLREEFEGTGIGLAIVRRIIARHGGNTWADSEPGAGATFYFSLPAGLETSGG